MKNRLLVIDPQYDFCNPEGSLFVKGAVEDMELLASFITKFGDKIDSIITTLDSHHWLDVAHPVFWVNKKGENPKPFTIITYDDVKDEVWLPYDIDLKNKMERYVMALEEGGKYPLCIWPPHCLVGSLGHTITQTLYEALVNWEDKNKSVVNYILKGSNIYTEHYSALLAEVPEDNDSSTHLNEQFINTLANSENILIAGEASSHCVANTVRDILKAFDDLDFSFSKKPELFLLKDATSAVPGFEKEEDCFVKEAVSKGLHITTTSSFFN